MVLILRRLAIDIVVVYRRLLHNSQVSYLLDHLQRACKISKRTTVACVHQECVLDLQNVKHRQLWLQVFPDGDADTEANVNALFATALL